MEGLNTLDKILKILEKEFEVIYCSFCGTPILESKGEGFVICGDCGQPFCGECVESEMTVAAKGTFCDGCYDPKKHGKEWFP